MYVYTDAVFVKAVCLLLLEHLLCFRQGNNPAYGVGAWQPQQSRVFVLASKAGYGFGSSECEISEMHTVLGRALGMGCF